MSTPTEPTARVECTVADLYDALGTANATVAEYVVRKLGQAGHVVRQLDHGTADDDPASDATPTTHKRTTSSKRKRA